MCEQNFFQNSRQTAKRLLVFGCWVLSSSLFAASLHAQDMDRVRHWIDTLCAPAFFGRGYVHQGDAKAADYLAEEFARLAVKPFGASYFQPFQYTVNTFPDAVALQVGRKILIPGRDFIPDPASGRALGFGKRVWLDTLIFTDPQAQESFLKSDLRGAVLVFDARYEQQLYQLPDKLIRKVLSVNALISLHEKLTFSVAREQLQLPKFNVLKSAFPSKGRKIRFESGATLKSVHEARNVIGYVEGIVQPDSFVVVSAHYDHLGGFGEHVFFPGANDNASGVALMLELAAHFQQNPPAYSLLFIAFAGEEAGLIGSRFYTFYPFTPLASIRFMLNLDMFGTGEQGMTVVNGSVHQEEFALLKHLSEQGQYLPAVKARGRAANSDHYFFSESGVPAFFCYLNGDWPHYHDIDDRPPLPLKGFKGAFRLMAEFMEALAKPVVGHE